MDELWGQVRERWLASNVEQCAPNSPASISAFEVRYHVVLPADVRAYFTSLNGIVDMDDDFYRFWPLHEVKPVHEELDKDFYSDRFSYPNCFVFADYMISCWLCAVRLTNDPQQSAPVFQVTASSKPGPQLAASFREFMEQYVVEPIQR